MNYQEELAKVENDRVALRAWQGEFRPELLRGIESAWAMGGRDKSREEIKKESEDPEAKIYHAELLKRLINPVFHVISRASIVPVIWSGRGSVLIDEFKSLLQAAIKLSAQSEREPKEGFFSRLFGKGKQAELRQIDGNLEALRSEAEQIVNKCVGIISGK